MIFIFNIGFVWSSPNPLRSPEKRYWCIVNDISVARKPYTFTIKIPHPNSRKVSFCEKKQFYNPQPNPEEWCFSLIRASGLKSGVVSVVYNSFCNFYPSGDDSNIGVGSIEHITGFNGVCSILRIRILTSFLLK